MGECTANPSYMSEHCADACRMQAERDRDMAAEIGEFAFFKSVSCVGSCSPMIYHNNFFLLQTRRLATSTPSLN